MPVVQKYQRQVQQAPIPGERRSSVPVTLLDTPRITAAPSAESFGAGLGQTVEHLGEGMLSDQMRIRDQEAQKAKAHQDRVAVLEADRKLSEWENLYLYDPKQGALNKRGKDSFGLPGSVSQDFEKTYGDIRDTLSTDEQRDTFDQLAHTRRNDVNGTVTRYVSGQLHQFEDQEHSAYLETSQTAAAANADDPLRVGTEIHRQRLAIQTYGEDNGTGPEWIKAQTEKSVSTTHVGVIDQLLASGQDKLAASHFANYKDEISGADLPRVEKALQIGNTRGESQRIADGIMSGQPVGQLEAGNIDLTNRPRVKNADGTVSTVRSISVEVDGKTVLLPTVSEDGKILSNKDAIAQYQKTGKHLGIFKDEAAADRYAEQLHNQQARMVNGESTAPTLSELLKQVDAIEDPDSNRQAEIRDAVEARVRNRYSVLRQEESDQRQQTLADHKDAIDQIMTNAANRIDATGTIDKAIPPAQWQQLNVGERTTLESYAKRKQAGPIQTDWRTYYGLMTAASDDPKNFGKANILSYMDKLGAAEFKQLTEIQAGIRKGEDKVHPDIDGFRTNTQIFNDTLTQSGIDPNPKPGDDPGNRVIELRRMVDDQVLALQRSTGKKASNQDIQGIMDRLLIDVTVKKGSWWNILPGGEPFNDINKKVFEIKPEDIPAADRQQIEDALRSQGRNVTDDAILNLYIATKQRLQKKP